MKDVTRRDMFAVGAAAAVGLTAKGAGAAEMTAQEKAHVAIVKEFCRLWGMGGSALTDIMSHMTDDVYFKINGQPPIVGKTAVTASFNSFFKNGEKYEMIINDTWAKGPVVVHYRTDTTIKTTGREPPGPIVGIYVFKDGKIAEWEEVIYKA
ncbi:MAG: nuclear transport factor 2 family protein [Rhodospirillaceae bacterium]|nr:nuclear transport factor 2 family protein [Rhodospirillaceae bacterium]